ncbi:hypothetical protein [Prevotella sp. lc2012]|uniref:hypothetical protein n=1 Tax=Prevotella sp. lc2012 TaxID=1761886 RepID=UPI00089AC951|nr:hypothetical protein [Prevotella sp. lc2012]SEE38128.1 hypothetical protein SAMN04487828_1354 [Prevotella sp. lc2012]
MKKKVLFGAAACMIAALSVVGLSTNKANSSDVTLNDMVMTSDVNAECAPPHWFGEGKCIGGWVCIFSYYSGVNNCDPYTSRDF